MAYYNKTVTTQEDVMGSELRAVDEVSEVEVDSDTLSKLDSEVKAKFPGRKVFHLFVPYVGNFYVRPQDQTDVKAALDAANKYINTRLLELGGEAALEGKPDEDKTRISREIDLAASDVSNVETLKRCVLYPYDFAEQLENDRLASGLIPLLSDKIMDISGWINVSIREV